MSSCCLVAGHLPFRTSSWALGEQRELVCAGLTEERPGQSRGWGGGGQGGGESPGPGGRRGAGGADSE